MRVPGRSSLFIAALAVIVVAGVWSMRGALPTAFAQRAALGAPAAAGGTSAGVPLTADLFRTIALQQNPAVVADQRPR